MAIADIADGSTEQWDKGVSKIEGLRESEPESCNPQINISLITVVHLRTLIYAQFGSDCVNC